MATNYGDLEIDVTIDGEVDGEVQEATGGIADKNYNHLNHKPQINSVELEGNKSLEDLGIPENLSDLGDVEITNIQNGQTLIYNSESEKFENADAGTGSGDMLKSVYDTNGDGSVDSADTLLGLEASVTELNALDGIEGNVQNQLNSKADSADLGTASTYDVPESGDAQSGEVVLGSDTRLSDSRNAKDVYLWAKQENKPTYYYSEIQNAPTVNNSTITIQKNSQNVDSFTLNQDSNKSINITVPTKTSDLQNDSSFITNTVNNLANYYLKNQTYTQTEVDNLIQAAVNGRFQKVNSLPVTGEPNIIYLVPKTTPETSNACDEYIWQDNAWELIGSTEIDLSDYVTDEDLTTALQDYLTTSAFNTAIANYYTKTEIGNLLDDKVDKVSGKGLSTNDYDATAKGIVDSVTSNLANKVDKENGKGLSTNDYDNTAKGIVDGVTSALADKVDKINGKGLSTEDYTTAEKTKLSGISDNANKVESSDTNGNIKINGTETQVYDDSDIQDVITEDTTAVTGNPLSFNTLSVQRASQTEILLNPIQDLHGFDKPWTGGAGKNKLPITVASVKAGNTSGTWSGNVYTLNNVTFTLLTDSDGNLVGIKTNGTASAQTRLLLTFELSANSYTITGTPSTGSSTTYRQIIYNNTTSSYIAYDNNAGATFTLNANSSLSYIIQILQDVNPNNAIFYPMIRFSSETDATYAPYTNYASISGRTGVGLFNNPQNIFEFEQGSRNANGTLVDTNSRVRSKYIYPLKAGFYRAKASTTVSGKVLRIAYNFWANTTTSNTRLYDSGWITLPNDGYIIYLSENQNFGCTFSYNDDSTILISGVTLEFDDSLTIQFGTTVYSGTLNVLKGQLVVDKVISKLKDLSWTYYSTPQIFYTESLDGIVKSPITSGRWCISNKYITFNGSYSDMPNGSILLSSSSSAQTHGTVVIKDLRYNDTTTFINSLTNDDVVCYELANPITIQLTPYQVSLLKDANYITTTGDAITLTYRDGTMATLGDLVNIPTKLSELYNDNDTVTDADYVHTDNNYTTSDKTKVSSVSTGATKTEASATNGNVKIDGTETQVYNDEEIQGKLTTATTQATGNPINFSTLSAQNAVSTIIDLEPIQDLHGYDKPWVGGAGKNLLPMSVDNIKSTNSTRTWTENSTVFKGITFTILTDSDNNVIGIKANGTATGFAQLYIKQSIGLTSGTYILNGAISSNKRMFFYDGTTWYDDYGSGKSFTISSQTTQEVAIVITSGTTVNNEVFYPMIRLSTESDATFQPYTNECGISGRSEIGILGCGKNLFDSRNKTDNRYVNVNGTIATTNDHWACGFNVDSNNNYAITPSDVNYNFVCAYNNSDNFIQALSITNGVVTNLPNNTKRIRWSYSKTNHQFTDNVQVEIGNQATADEPYTKSTDLTISLGQTVYGGSLDVENGVLTVDKVIEEYDGSNDENWVRWENKQYSFRNNTLQDHIQPPDNNTIVAGTKTNELTPDTPGHVFSQTNNYTFSLDQSATRISVCIDSTIDSVTKLRNWLSNNPLQLCYPLATPTVIQLTPHQISLLKGINNISVSDDYSEITLTYRNGEVATLGDLLETENKMLAKQHVYSTDEQIVATWIDGKPLYEKCIEIASLPSSATDDGLYSTGLSNIDKMWIVGGYVEYNNGEQMLPLNTWRLSSTYAVGCRITNDNYITFSVGTDRSSLSAVVVLQYTKTTD